MNRESQSRGSQSRGSQSEAIRRGGRLPLAGCDCGFPVPDGNGPERLGASVECSHMGQDWLGRRSHDVFPGAVVAEAAD